MTKFLPVVEKFHSLQGEGFHSGKSAFFIRLAGCKVGCSWPQDLWVFSVQVVSRWRRCGSALCAFCVAVWSRMLPLQHCQVATGRRNRPWHWSFASPHHGSAVLMLSEIFHDELMTSVYSELCSYVASCWVTVGTTVRVAGLEGFQWLFTRAHTRIHTHTYIPTPTHARYKKTYMDI